MQITLTPNNIDGFDVKEVDNLQKLINLYNSYYSKNELKNKYYEGLFLEGSPNGEGFYTEDGNISKVLFSKGEFIKFIS